MYETDETMELSKKEGKSVIHFHCKAPKFLDLF